MTQGKIIEYIDQGRFVCTLCLQDKGAKLRLLTPSNREVSLSPKRTVLISEATIDVSQPREALLERLGKIEQIRLGLKRQVDIKELWELVREEEETYDHEYLAQLAFGETITGDHFSAVMRALFESRLYFRMKNRRFLPNTLERVETIKRQREEEALKEEWLGRGSFWLKEIQQGREPDEPALKADIVDLLIQLAVYGNDAPEFKRGKELLSNAGISDIREARHLLVKLGEWEEDENLALLRTGIETSFTKTQLEESVRLAGIETGLDGREDLRDLSVLTIDGPLTQDYDDAISLETVGDELRVGIHIADVAASISVDSIIDRAAAERASSLYLPSRQIAMIPTDLSQDSLSLRQGLDRKTISVLARFDKAGSMLDYRFVPGVIRVRHRFNYDEVNGIIDKEALFKELFRFTQQLRRKRMNQGALSLSLPDLEVSVSEDASLSLELVEQDTPSRMIVAELMILYNCLAARFCRDTRIPVLFRAQPEPNEKLPLDEKGYLYYVFQQRRRLSPLQIGTKPGPHSGLGLDAYTQATSPIRRYMDLVNQRQIRSFLLGEALTYDEKRLEEIRISVEPLIRNLGIIKRDRLRYWTLKYLGHNIGKTFNAVVINELKSKYRIVLADFLMVSDMKRQNGMILSQGQKIMVRVKRVDPWEGVIVLDYVDEG